MKRVSLHIEINLRDYAALEDLASELGFSIEVVGIVNGAAEEKKEESQPRKHHRVTREIVKQVRDYRKVHPDHSLDEIKEGLGLQIHRTTIGRILRKERH